MEFSKTNIKVIIFTPGEGPADLFSGYLDNKTITGLYAQEVKGAVILIEREHDPYTRSTCLRSIRSNT